jgi:hypothetical protein
VLVAKGKREVAFDLAKDPPAPDELAKHVLGPSGNLRAPAIRRGKTWLVGYNEAMYDGVLG